MNNISPIAPLNSISAITGPVDIPVTMLRADPENTRTIPDPQADAQLLESVRDHGVTVPLLVRPDPETVGNYVVVYGHRRRMAAIGAGHETVPALVNENLSEADARALQVIENGMRADLHPVDQWKQINALLAVGFDLKGAARVVGVTDRRAEQLQKLSSLHPKILAALTEDYSAKQRQIQAMANAPLEVQEEAFDAHGDDWYNVAEACTVRRLSKTVAIFDTDKAGVLFECDIFAEPGSAEEWTTTDIKGFVAAQKAAVEAQVAASKGRKALAQTDEYGSIRMPQGYQRAYGDIPKRFTKDDPRVIFMAVADKGYRIGHVETAMGQLLPKSTPESQGGTATGGSHSSGGSTSASDHTPPARDPISKVGRDKIAQAKRAAVQVALSYFANNDADAEEGSVKLMTLMLLALSAKNVTVKGEPEQPWSVTSFDDLSAKLVTDDGKLRDDLGVLDVRLLAAEAISRIMLYETPVRPGHSSGQPAEWIGEAVQAHRAIGRFDDKEFLTTVNADTLRQIAAVTGAKSSGTAGALRERLTGKAPDWRPAPSAFGAPGFSSAKAVKMVAGEDDDDDALPDDADPDAGGLNASAEDDEGIDPNAPIEE